jgi:hypothetical protein
VIFGRKYTFILKKKFIRENAMKMVRKLSFSIAAMAGLSSVLSPQAEAFVISSASMIIAQPDSVPKLPPLSGISVFPNNSTGTYTLHFSQELKEAASLKVTNAKKKIVYTNKLGPQPSNTITAFEVGKLYKGIYLVEVKTSNTTYWKELKITGKALKK